MSRRVLLAAFLVVATAAAGAVLLLPGSHPGLQDRALLSAGSSTAHLLGTDALGRDRLVRLAAALLLGLGGAGAAAAASTALAALVGLGAALAPRRVRWAVLLLCDLFLSLPWLFLLMIARGGLPLGASPALLATVTFALLAALGWPACARAVAREAGHLLRSGPVLLGRAGGLAPLALLRIHLLPALRPLLLPQFLVSLPAFVMAEADLGTLGLGVPEPLPSWGGMLAELNGAALLGHVGLALVPLALLVAVLLLLRGLGGSRPDAVAR